MSRRRCLVVPSALLSVVPRLPSLRCSISLFLAVVIKPDFLEPCPSILPFFRRMSVPNRRADLWVHCYLTVECGEQSTLLLLSALLWLSWSLLRMDE